MNEYEKGFVDAYSMSLVIDSRKEFPEEYEKLQQ